MNQRTNVFDTLVPNYYYRTSVGFDRLFTELATKLASHEAINTGNYPPYNIIKLSDSEYAIEVAVAGFREDEIEVQLDNQTLLITGHAKTKTDCQKIVHQGIGKRDFTRQFSLADHVEITGAKVENGILSVSLQHQIPEAQKPKKIAIAFKT